MRFNISITQGENKFTKQNKTIWHVIGVLLVVAAGKAPAVVQLETIM